MKKGDIIINPYVSKTFRGEPNPCYAIIYLGNDEYGDYRCVDINGNVGSFCKTREGERPYRVVGHIDLYELISQFIDYAEID